jgi:Zn-dependent protease with chaperone function/Zn-finger nucleic acid-binding protein
MSETTTMSKTTTMFEIEREARWRVWALFALLLAMVYVCVWVVVMAVEAVIEASTLLEVGTDRHYLAFSLSLRGAAIIFLVSTLVALFYWNVSRIGARDHMVRVMHAQPLDPDDRFHQRLADIVEEMRIATGGPAVRCLTVATAGMNAFAFSDLHGGACIGVTEGALSRLSRQQLEGVVAHEFGHILSGDYVTVTSACLLFGVYTSLGGALDDAVVSSPYARNAPLLVGAVALRGLLGLLQLGSAVTNAAISRQREWAADLAAARYTRDPLSLAQALEMMARHPGGGGYIPAGLSALCIRPTDLYPRSAVQRAMATHPPIKDREVRLLNIAHVSWEQFQQQVAVAEQTFDEREHVSAAPGASAAAGATALAAGIVTGAPAVAVAAAIGAAPAVVATIGAASAVAAPAAAASAVAMQPTMQPATPPITAPTTQPPAAPATAPPAPLAHTASLPPAAADSLHCHDTHVPAVACPACGVPLESCDYEGATVFICRTCGGRLATTTQVQRILTRREMRFDERQQQLADYVVQHGDELRRDFARRRGAKEMKLMACPRCGRTMMRRHYSYDYAIEVDFCDVCDLFWFDADELEALQVIVERAAP